MKEKTIYISDLLPGKEISFPLKEKCEEFEEEISLIQFIIEFYHRAGGKAGIKHEISVVNGRTTGYSLIMIKQTEPDNVGLGEIIQYNFRPLEFYRYSEEIIENIIKWIQIEKELFEELPKSYKGPSGKHIAELRLQITDNIEKIEKIKERMLKYKEEKK